MRALAALRAPVDAFFDKVLVNSDDRCGTRQPAAASGRRCATPMGRVADFSPGHRVERDIDDGRDDDQDALGLRLRRRRADGDASMKDLLGGKGANLAEMSSLGLPVPPGFTITTEACIHFYANGAAYPAGLRGAGRRRRWRRSRS